jgi:hypothetical protein
MTPDQQDAVAQRLAELVAAIKKTTELLTSGQMTLAQADEQIAEDMARCRMEMTYEEFRLLGEEIGKIAYLGEQHLSSLGFPIPGNDPQRPNETRGRGPLVSPLLWPPPLRYENKILVASAITD